MTRDRGTERTSGRDPSAENRDEDPPPANGSEEPPEPDHRFRDWALI